MDKKTLLALGLSFLVFLVWSVLFGPKPKDESNDKQAIPSQEQNRQQDQSKTLLEEKPLSTGSKRDLTLEAGEGANDITVETARYIATFSGSGPLIKSFKLKQYRSTLEKGSPLKELIHVKNKNGYGFHLGFFGQSIPNVDWRTYKVNRNKIALRPGDQQQELIYERESPRGIKIQTKK